MSEKRITVALTWDEFVALRDRAERDLRNPHDQARYIIRNALFGDGATPDPISPIESGAALDQSTGTALKVQS